MKRPLLALVGVFVLVVIALAVWRASLPAPPAQRAPPLPLTFSQTTPAAKVDLKIDERLKPYPLLVERLYQDGVQELKSFAAQAAEDQARLAAKGIPVRPYQHTISWRLTAANANLVSVEQDWFDDTGGAHPNSGAKGLLWDPYMEREVARPELFRADADHAALDQLLCRQVQARKAGRQGAVFDPSVWPCPRWEDADFVLAGSTRPHKFGGIVFLFDPYSIGPYVEGEWRVLVPQSDFKTALSTDWAGQFAGQPQ